MLQKSFTKNFLASIVVFLIAIPLCLGIAIASGVSPIAGLVSGIIGGIVVGWLSGCSLQVSGPAAGLATLNYDIIQESGLENLALILLVAGLIQILFSYFKLGQWFRVVSPAVVHGMLAGIGILIVASQVHIMIDDKTRSNCIENLASIPESVIKTMTFDQGFDAHNFAAVLGLFTIFVIITWDSLTKRFPYLKILPASLIGVSLATILAWFFKININYINIPDNISEGLNPLNIGSLDYLFTNSCWIAALSIALIASAESLLTAVAVDKISKSNQVNYDKELFAQGVGNGLAGIVGALPITGVMVRSAANIHAGATNRSAAIFHGMWILLFVTLFPSVLGIIPVASLAAVLVYSGSALIDFTVMKRLFKADKLELGIYIITVVFIMYTNILEGIIIGLIATAVKLLISLSKLEVKHRDNGNQIDIFVKGNANFISLNNLADALEKLPAKKEVNIILNNMTHIDHTCLEFLINWKDSYSQAGGKINIRGNESLYTAPLS